MQHTSRQSAIPTPFTLLSLPSLLPTLLLLFSLTSSPLLHLHHPGSPSPGLCQAMDVQKLCQARCYYGRGGNLCNCNAFHFAGKRSGGGGNSISSNGDVNAQGEAFQPLGSRPLLELALADMERKEEEVEEGRGPASSAASAVDVLQGIPLASLTDDNSREGDSRPTPRGAGGRRGGGAAAGARGAGLFDVSRVTAEEEEAEGDRERAVNRLSSLIKTALDQRLMDRYEGSRKRKQSALPYEEAEFVY